MNCANHPATDAVGVCIRCGKYICETCKVPSSGEIYCKQCISEKAGTSVKQKKSPILAAVLSFLMGGLGQIYNGQPGKALLIFFTQWLIIPWIYGIVNAYRTANLINEGLIEIPKKTGCLVTAIIIMILVPVTIFILALLSAIAIPTFLQAKATAQTNLCRNNLRLIYHAKESYAVENNLAPGATLPQTDYNGINDGDDIPDALEEYLNNPMNCPSGGLYNIGPIGEAPTCSLGGDHTIE